jgi:RNA polymerase sigma factor (sigma-70 family)
MKQHEEIRDESINSEFRVLIEEVRSGSHDAAWELVNRYGDDVQRFVRRSLNRQLRAKFDSLDFVQIVWGSFFRNPEQLREMERPEQLIAFLATLAKFKVLTEVRRRLQTQKYDVRREQALSDDSRPISSNDVPTITTPSAVAMARERWYRLLSGENERVRSIVSLRLAGESFVEIAAKLHIDERTVRRAIERLTAKTTE